MMNNTENVLALFDPNEKTLCCLPSEPSQILSRDLIVNLFRFDR